MWLNSQCAEQLSEDRKGLGSTLCRQLITATPGLDPRPPLQPFWDSVSPPAWWWSWTGSLGLDLVQRSYGGRGDGGRGLTLSCVPQLELCLPSAEEIFARLFFKKFESPCLFQLLSFR